MDLTPLKEEEEEEPLLGKTSSLWRKHWACALIVVCALLWATAVAWLACTHRTYFAIFLGLAPFANPGSWVVACLLVDSWLNKCSR
jgi:hypothetical protein